MPADVSTTKAEEQASKIRQLCEDHADPSAWAKITELCSRGWTFPGLSRELNVGGFDVERALTAPYSGSPLANGLPCAIGATVKELVGAAALWEADQMRRKPEVRSKHVVPAYRWPDES